MSTDTEKQERLNTRIAGLLRKAERTDNAAEAEAFMAKAEELMLRYAISRASLEQLGKVAKDPITTLKHFSF